MCYYTIYIALFLTSSSSRRFSDSRNGGIGTIFREFAKGEWSITRAIVAGSARVLASYITPTCIGGRMIPFCLYFVYCGAATVQYSTVLSSCMGLKIVI